MAWKYKPWIGGDLTPFLKDQRYARAGPRSSAKGLLSHSSVAGFPSVFCCWPFVMTRLAVIPSVVGAHVDSRFIDPVKMQTHTRCPSDAIAIAMPPSGREKVKTRVSRTRLATATRFRDGGEPGDGITKSSHQRRVATNTTTLNLGRTADKQYRCLEMKAYLAALEPLDAPCEVPLAAGWPVLGLYW